MYICIYVYIYVVNHPKSTAKFLVMSERNASSYAATTGSRSSPRRCSVKLGAPENLTNLTGKHLCWSLLFNKVAGLQVCNFIKKRLQHNCFPVKFVKFLRTHILKNICKRLLLSVVCFAKQSFPSAKVMIFITFESRDKTYSKI